MAGTLQVRPLGYYDTFNMLHDSNPEPTPFSYSCLNASGLDDDLDELTATWYNSNGEIVSNDLESRNWII